MTPIIPIIICGGAGSRLWPISREAHPKPFMRLPDGGNLIGKTYARAARLPGVRRIVTVTNRDLLFLTTDAYAEATDIHALAQAPAVENTFLLEPMGRDTAAAVALATLHVAQTQGGEAILLILPADHLIRDEPAFAKAVAQAQALAVAGRIVTFGIRPDRPETGFGYIETKGNDVLRFVEKPDEKTAAQYLASGRFYWNSGMFCFAARTMLDAMEAHCADVLAGARAALDAADRKNMDKASVVQVNTEFFAATPAISIDYAVMEKAKNVACVPVECGWSDIGSWTTMAELLTADECGNCAVGETVLEDAENCFVLFGRSPCRSGRRLRSSCR